MNRKNQIKKPRLHEALSASFKKKVNACRGITLDLAKKQAGIWVKVSSPV